MKLEDLKNKKILIVGYGIEGKATYKFLKKKFPEARIDIADKENAPNYLERQNEYDLAIRSPSVSPRELTIPYTTATNIFFANTKGFTIGVTGSKGKSTTSSLIFTILKEAQFNVHLVGNIGTPMLALLDKEEGKKTYYVCELSSYQLEDITYSPDIALIINLFPEHMDYHGSAEAYYQAKKRILEKATEKTIFVYNPDYPELTELSRQIKGKSIPFVGSIPIKENQIPLLGKHNRDNVRAAWTVARVLDIDDGIIMEAVKKFTPLRHRLQYVGEFHGIRFFDDAISTTPQSALCAIESLAPIGTIFLGGKQRGYDFSELVQAVERADILNVVLFPDSGEAIKKEIEKRALRVRLLETRDMEEAVQFAYQYTPPGMICLLSTASPSYGIWKNFEEKGDLFQKYVKQYS
jgi:UDP-N-acetylmuramoylalanine--D-glutamate ligase